MKVFERIVLYSVLVALIALVFYMFLINDDFGNKGAIQEEVKAKRIVIVNDEGQEVIKLGFFQDSGAIVFFDKAGTLVASMLGDKNGGKIALFDKARTCVVAMGAG